ncbi:hypothetical protein Tco_0080080, partial [Tanacetum coccineum]
IAIVADNDVTLEPRWSSRRGGRVDEMVLSVLLVASENEREDDKQYI